MKKDETFKEYFTAKQKKIEKLIDAGRTEKAKEELADLIGFSAYAVGKGVTFFSTVADDVSDRQMKKYTRTASLMLIAAFDHFMPDTITMADEEEEDDLDDFLDKLIGSDDSEEDEEEEEPEEETEEPEEDLTEILKRIFGKRK